MNMYQAIKGVTDQGKMSLAVVNACMESLKGGRQIFGNAAPTRTLEGLKNS